MENTVSESKNTHQWIGDADNEAMQRVQGWLAEGRTLAWLPIFSRENFPDIPPEILYFADRCREHPYWPIEKPEDFLQIPEGITGWLLRVGDKDTDIVVGFWEDTAHFLKAVDKRTGEPQSLQSGRNWEDDETNDDSAEEATR